MRIYIDCEWNSYRGELISVALVTADGQEFYEVLGCDNPDPWIAENVMPKLRKDAVPLPFLQAKLQEFLLQFHVVTIVADWPEDIERFCWLLITGPGTRLDTPPLMMSVVRVDSVSADPHNALADARGLRAAMED